jgi:hypothetical protein
VPNHYQYDNGFLSLKDIKILYIHCINMDYTNEEIQNILKKYKENRERDRIRYEKRKLDPVFVAKNRERAREHYHKNRGEVKQYYDNNREAMRAKSNYRYWLKKGDIGIQKFKEKHPEKYDLLVSIGYIN